MMKLSESRDWTNEQCAEYLADQVLALGPEADARAVLIAANDAYLDSVGNLQVFAAAVRHSVVTGTTGPEVSLVLAHLHEAA